MSDASPAPLKLPRSLENHPRREAVEKAMYRDVRLLRPEGTLEVPHVPMTPPLVKTLSTAVNRQQATRGLEQIEALLEAERKGIDAVREKQGAPPARRISRVLIVAEGGSERHYRHCESLLRKHGDRVLGIKLEATSEELSNAVFGSGKQAKALAVTDKDAVVAVLLALAS